MSRTSIVRIAGAVLILAAGAATGRAAADLTWEGGVSNEWDTATANWQNGGGATTYADGDNVTFDDTFIAADQDIDLVGNLAPGSMAFNNSGFTYILRAADTATITAGTLAKDGTDSAVFIEDIDNPYTFGDITVDGGRLYFRADNDGTSHGFSTSFGSGTITVNDGGTFRVNLTNGGNKRFFTLTNPFVVSGQAEIEVGRGDAGTGSDGNSPDFSVHLSGAMTLAGDLAVDAEAGGGAQGGTHHSLAGIITVDQSAAGSRSIARRGNGNQDFSVSGNLVDDPVGLAANALTLEMAGERNFFISGDNTGFTKGLVVAGDGELVQFVQEASLGGGGAGNVEISGTATAGLNFDPSPAAIAKISAASTGILGLGEDTSTAIDLSVATGTGADIRIGSHTAATYSGTLTPFGPTYKLGGAGGSLTLDQANALVDDGGARGLDVDGPGTVHLTASNSYTAGTAIDGGTLNADAATAVGTGPVTVNGGTFNANAAGAMGAAAALTLNGGTAASNVPASLSTQDIPMSGGTLRGGATQTLPNNLTLTGSATLASASGALTTFTGQIDVGGNTLGIGGGGAVKIDNAGNTTGTGDIDVDSGLLAVPDMANLPGGNLALDDGAFLLDPTGTDAVTPAAFMAARTYGSGDGQWQSQGGGLAARGGAVQISDAILDAQGFDRDFTLGSTALVDGALYADSGIEITSDINLTDDRRWSFHGANQESDTNWTIVGPVHEISGKISSTGDVDLFLIGESAKGAPLGGTLRLSNAANDFTGTLTVAGVAHDSGGVVAIATDDGVFGNAANFVQVKDGGNGPDGLLLFEDVSGTGKTFSRDFTVFSGDASGGQGGWGSYGGEVTYTGTVTADGGGQDELPVQVVAGTLTLGNASPATLANERSKNISLRKGLDGELVLKDVVYASTTGMKQTWQLYGGTLTTVTAPDGMPAGFLTTGDNLDIDDLLAATTDGTARTWRISGVDQTYDDVDGGNFADNAAIEVDAGLTLTLNMEPGEALINTEKHGSGAVFAMYKRGEGTWVYNTTATGGFGKGKGFVTAQEGLAVLNGSMGRASLRLDGGDVLVDADAPFAKAEHSENNQFEIASNGGSLGIIDGETSDVSRDADIDAWDQSAPAVVTFASRSGTDETDTDYDANLIFDANNAFPDVEGPTTLMIERLGSYSGTGAGAPGDETSYVRIDNDALGVAGTIGGSGTLRLKSDSSGVLNVTGGTVTPGSSIGTLTLQSDVVFGDDSALAVELTGNINDGTIGNDVLAVAGVMNMDSSFDAMALTWVPGADATSKFGGTYVVADYGTRSGIFDTLGGKTADPFSIPEEYVHGATYDWDGDQIALMLYSLLDGDATLNGQVGDEDFSVLLGNWGETDQDWFNADFNFNGQVGDEDFALLLGNWGATTPGVGGAAPTPEPATVALMALGVAGLLARRRRR